MKFVVFYFLAHNYIKGQLFSITETISFVCFLFDFFFLLYYFFINSIIVMTRIIQMTLILPFIINNLLYDFFYITIDLKMSNDDCLANFYILIKMILSVAFMMYNRRHFIVYMQIFKLYRYLYNFSKLLQFIIRLCYRFI